MATSRSGSKSTTRALRLRPAGLRTVVPWVPATTWAFVSTMPGPTGKPLPKTMPPQPNPWIFSVSSAAARTPGVFAVAGRGRADGATGSSPENAAGKLTPAMIVANPVADAAADRAEHDQDEHRPQRPHRRVGDFERIHHNRGQGGTHDHAQHESRVLRQGEPEAAAISAADGKYDRDQDDEIDDGE